ncbi:hypothetical protein [Myroides indicus]|uniref:Lipoprotein n=1 Tax=Myroides indicus TaxID=1323422 RepID=A0A4R7EQX0_9FLAO|nr:hypothetical protein [Myroides indicus]TDS54652.1 hypothetical protein C8P70_12448 [Myroides indicus]
MLKVKFLLLYTVFLSLCFSSCKDTSKNATSLNKSEKSSQQEKAVQIPMHGTGENSSSSSNKRFEMDKTTQEMLQNQKKEE